MRKWHHANEFLDIKVSAHDTSIFLAETGVIRDGVPCRAISVFAIPGDKSDVLSVPKELSIADSGTTSMFWESRDSVVTSTSSGLSMYRLDSSSQALSTLRTLQTESACGGAVADPHHPFTIGFAENRSLSLWDYRTKDVSLKFKTSHFFPILSLDANPNLDNVYVTGGADGRMMFWDVRQPVGSFPLNWVDAHTHHVTSVKFHPIHDQLVMTCGTDCGVNLWRFQMISSSPKRLKPLVEAALPPAASAQTSQRRSSIPVGPVAVLRENDGLIEKFNRHEDCVYRGCWSGWVMASAGIDGTVMFSSVPAAEKYRIML